MKLRFVLLGVLLMTLSAAHARTPARVTANDGFIYLKLSKQMCGGSIEVSDSTGHVVFASTIDHRHMYVDLFDKADGRYIVKIKAGDTVLEFTCTLESRELHTKRKHHHGNGTSNMWWLDDRALRMV